jgi:hypothetical protein
MSAGEDIRSGGGTTYRVHTWSISRPGSGPSENLPKMKARPNRRSGRFIPRKPAGMSANKHPRDRRRRLAPARRAAHRRGVRARLGGYVHERETAAPVNLPVRASIPA